MKKLKHCKNWGLYMDWKDKRINAINRIIKNKYQHEYYIQEYCSILNSKAKNKKQYKQQKAGK